MADKKEIPQKQEETEAPQKKVKKRILRNVPEGEIHIRATYNNTLITACDLEGNVLAWTSSGAAGFKGSRKPTPYASSVAAANLATKLKNFGFTKAHVYIRGVGSGREQSVRALQANGISIVSIRDVTPVPHNGCRQKKPRRV
ncbi:MAG: 30S ribosomal protein S11 [Candidatus Abawacabacteria bacterium]|nr:30S ribosomal protein S11 [Candidatus Abawacabacteria bacterium]